MSGPTQNLRDDLARIEAALHHKPLPAARVLEHRRRIERMQAQLVRLDDLIRQTCSHDGVLSDNGVCLSCNLDGLPVDPVSHRLPEGFQSQPPPPR